MTQIPTAIGAIALRVADVDAMTRFYSQTIGLQHLRDEENARIMGAGERALIALIPSPDGVPAPRTTGLFHLALRIPERHQLAQVLAHFAQSRTPLQGLSDHIVSEAIYLADPEGNGIEIYWDKPQTYWYDTGGKMQMDTLPLNTDDLFAELAQSGVQWTGLPDGTDMGHIHLRVADVARARRWYEETLGMQTMFDMGSAAFLSYDGYHHHVGINAWGGRTPPPANALGLDHFVLHRALSDTPATLTDPDTHKVVIEA
jgi:catechol 2,3-dioxygenase